MKLLMSFDMTSARRCVFCVRSLSQSFGARIWAHEASPVPNLPLQELSQAAEACADPGFTGDLHIIWTRTRVYLVTIRIHDDATEFTIQRVNSTAPDESAVLFQVQTSRVDFIRATARMLDSVDRAEYARFYEPSPSAPWAARSVYRFPSETQQHLHNYLQDHEAAP